MVLLHEKQAVYWRLAYSEVEEDYEEPGLSIDDFVLGPFNEVCLGEKPPEIDRYVPLGDWNDWFPPPPRMTEWELYDLSDWVEIEAAKHDLLPDPDTYPLEDYFLIRRPMKPKMISINIPVPPPPILEQAVGYPDEAGARYLSLWWECADDEVILSDAAEITYGNGEGYLAYVHHKAVYPHLTSYNLGSSDEPAKYHLLIDLILRKAYVASSRDAERIMDENMQREADEIEKMTLSDEEAKALAMAIQEALQETDVDDELPPSIEEERQAVLELTRWLDDQLK